MNSRHPYPFHAYGTGTATARTPAQQAQARALERYRAAKAQPKGILQNALAMLRRTR
jgi:hypothetical protein